MTALFRHLKYPTFIMFECVCNARYYILVYLDIYICNDRICVTHKEMYILFL